MLKIKDANVIMEEVDAGCAKRDLFLRNENEALARVHGPGYLGEARAYTDHENHGFEWIALHAGKLIANNPSVGLTAFGDENAVAEAKLLKEAVNQDVRKADLRRLMQDTFPAFSVFWHVTATNSEPQPGEDGQEYPMHCAHTAPIMRKDFFLDVHANRWANVMIAGHRIVCQKNDLLARAKAKPEEGWDLAAIRAIRPRGNVRQDDEDNEEQHRGSSVERGEIDFWYVWVIQDDKEALKRAGIKKSQMHAEDNGDRLYTGTILTLATEAVRGDRKQSRFLRANFPYFGAPCDDTIRGPYVMHGCYPVEKYPFPLSPVMSVWHQNQELNAHVDRMLKHSRKARRFNAIDGNNTDDNKKLENAEDGAVIVVNGIDKNRHIEFNFDGISPEDINTYTILKTRRNEAAGMPMSSRGATENTTATSVDRAADASDTRAEFCAQRMADGWNAVIKQRAWLLRNDYRTCLRLKSGLYLGGFEPEKAIRYALARKLIRAEEADQLLQPEVLEQMQILRLPWQQLDIQIDLFSMQRTTAALQQARLQTGLTTVVDAAPVMAQTPYIQWKDWLNKMGESLNWPDYGEMVDLEMLDQYAQALAEAQADGGGEKQTQGAIRSPQTNKPASQGPQKPGEKGGKGGKPKTGTSGNSSGARLAGAARGGR